VDGGRFLGSFVFSELVFCVAPETTACLEEVCICLLSSFAFGCEEEESNGGSVFQ